MRRDSELLALCDRFFDAKQAVSYGICDEVIGEGGDEKAAEAAADATKPK